MHQRLRSPLLATLAVSALVFAGILGVRAAGALEALGLAAYDWHILLRPASPRPAPPVVLVTVTEEDIQQLGTWPLTDDVLATVIENLLRAGARVIGLDIYRDVPVPPGHERLNAVFGAHPQVIATMKFPHRDRPGVAPPPVLKGTEQVGFTDMPVDPDGTVRRGLLFLDDGQAAYQSLALRAASLYFQAEGVPISADPTDPTHIRFGQTTIRPFEPNYGSYVRADAGGYQFLLDYRDPPNAFAAITLGELLAGRFDPALIRDKVVLVGVTAESVKDSFYTPYNQKFGEKEPMYGVVVHAHVVSQLLRTGIHGDAPVAVVSDINESLWILLWCLLGGVVAFTARSTVHFAVVVVGGLALLIVGVHGLFALGWWIPLASPALGGVGAAGLAMAYLQIRQKKERAALKSIFQHYVAPDVVELILKDPAGVRLGGEEKVLTALLSDMEGFSTYSERHTPKEIITVLSDYYAEMTDEIFAVQGTLVEYVGDELFALYGAPVTQPDHAKRACACALAMQARRAALGDAWEKIGRPRIKARTGINSGNMLVGNIGSKYRIHYAATGDSVNLASRLEGLNKIYGTEIIISGDTAELVAGAFRLRELDLTRVKGREQALRIYELLGVMDMPLPAELGELLELYEAGLTPYREQRWDEALELYGKCLRLRPNDGPSKLMEWRCRSFRDNPPPEDWDGTFEDRRGRHAK